MTKSISHMRIRARRCSRCRSWPAGKPSAWCDVMRISAASISPRDVGCYASSPRLRRAHASRYSRQPYGGARSSSEFHLRSDRVPRHLDLLILGSLDQSELDQPGHVRVYVLVIAPKQPCELVDGHRPRTLQGFEQRPARRGEILEQYRQALEGEAYLGASGLSGNVSLPRLLEPVERTRYITDGYFNFPLHTCLRISECP